MALVNLVLEKKHGVFGGDKIYRGRYIFMQETWLSDHTCYKLYDSLDNFECFHSSAMEKKVCSNIMAGHPFRGTAVLIRKSLVPLCTQVITDNS